VTSRQLVRPLAAPQAPLLARPYYSEQGTSPIVTSLAHVPEALAVTMPFIATVLGPSAIGARTKELAILRTSARLGCEYCVATHSVVALDSGCTAAEVRALRVGTDESDAIFSAAERALLRWVDAVIGATGAVAPAADLAAHYDEAEIVELTLLCAATLMLNRYCTALGLPVSAATVERLAAEGL